MPAVKIIVTTTFYRLKLILGNRLLFFVMVITPLLLTFIAGNALRMEKYQEVRIAVIDYDNSEFSQMLIDGVERQGIQLFRCNTPDEGAKLIKDGVVEAVFIISEKFEKNVKEGKTEDLLELTYAPSSFISGYSGEIIAGEVLKIVMKNSAITSVKEEYSMKGIEIEDNLDEAVAEYYDSQWVPEPLMKIEYSELGKNTETNTESIVPVNLGNMSRGFLLVFLMFYILFSSGWLVEERVNGTIGRIVSVPQGLMYTFLGNILALLICSVFQVLVFTAGLKIISGVLVIGDLLTILLLFLYILAIISINMLLAALFTTANRLQAAAPAVAFISSFIGGCFWSFADMPGQLKRLSMLTPQGWALMGFNNISAYGYMNSEVLATFLVLAFIPLILLPVSYKIVRRKIS